MPFTIGFPEPDVHRWEGRCTDCPAGGRPVVLYIHGGGFRILSKDTHWLMTLVFARRGYRVFNINYRQLIIADAARRLQSMAEVIQAIDRTWLRLSARGTAP